MEVSPMRSRGPRRRNVQSDRHALATQCKPTPVRGVQNADVTSNSPPTVTMKFALRGEEGRVTIAYSVNEDPARWGFDLLDLDWQIEVSRGFPVIQAEPSFPREGYAGVLGWVQVVDYVVVRDGVFEERVWVVPDVPPQSLDANMPYVAFGINPVFFDAPASPEKNVDWTARTFLSAEAARCCVGKRVTSPSP
jgi:hypothetical protein